MEATDYAKFVLALLFVLALIGLLAVLARRFGLGPAQARGGRGLHKRLRIVEVAPLDAKRRMVLVRRDDMEHLVILGHNGETVVETGIQAPADDVAEAPAAPNSFSAVLKRTNAPTGKPEDDV